MRWTAPPNWPAPPLGWTPPPEWQPDPSWGPPPAEWQWWQPVGEDEPSRTRAAEAAQGADEQTESVDAEPDDEATPDAAYVGQKVGEKRLQVIAGAFVTGEQLLAAVRVLAPFDADVFVVTNVRIFTAMTSRLAQRGPTAGISGDRITDVDIRGRSRALIVHDTDGTEHALGQLARREDVDGVRQATHRLIDLAASPLLRSALDDDLLSQQQWPEAVRAFRQDAIDLLNRAEQLTAEGQFEEAENALRLAVRLRDRAPRNVRDRLQEIIEREMASRREDGRLEDPVAWRLRAAEARAASGDIAGEESLIWQVRELAGTKGASQMDRKSAEEAISGSVARGSLRRGARHLGSIQMQQQGADVASKPRRMLQWLDYRDLEIYTDRLIYGKDAYPLDGRISVTVEVDGQVTSSSRPTLTRMAAGSVLPGSALLPGLALQKKTTVDDRSAVLLIVHPEWNLTLRLNPDGLGPVRPVIARLEVAVRELERTESARLGRDQSQLAAGPTGAKLDKLERIAALKASGVLSEERARAMTEEILSAPE